MIRAAAVLACVLAAGAAAAQPLSTDALMQRLRQVTASEVRFTETRESSLAKAPLVASGRLVWRRPDRLEKHVLSPFVESTVIEGSRVTMTRGGNDPARTMSVPSGPAQALVEALRATLAGDRPALERHFDVYVAGSADAWTMTLIPREVALTGYVLRVEISGAGERLARIEVREASGDRVVTLLEGGAR